MTMATVKEEITHITRIDRFLEPECRLGLDELKAVGVVADCNMGNHWRLYGRHDGYFCAQRCSFPLWLSQLLHEVTVTAKKNAQAEMRRALGLEDE